MGNQERRGPRQVQWGHQKGGWCPQGGVEPAKLVPYEPRKCRHVDLRWGSHCASWAPMLLLLFSQYDWCSWIPNAPPTMRAPPPTAKGVVTIEQIVDTLPDRGRSCWHLGAVWALSQFQENEVRPGIAGNSVDHFSFNSISSPQLWGSGSSWKPVAKNPDF